MMKIRWGNYFSDTFTVSNGASQGGILSPYLFSLYIDDLTHSLNTIKAGCYVGNHSLNYIMFADDICLFSPNLVGLQDLLNKCYKKARHIKCYLIVVNHFACTNKFLSIFLFKAIG